MNNKIKNGRCVNDNGIFWYKNNLLHREDGPAIEDRYGNKMWFVEDIQYSEEEFHLYRERKLMNDLLQSTLSEKKSYHKAKI